MVYFNYLIGSMILIPIVTAIPPSFLHKAVDGKLSHSMRISIGVTFRDIGGVILYATDTDRNKLLVTTGQGFFVNRQFIYYFNNCSLETTVNNYFSYSIIQWSALLKFENDNLYFQYDGRNVMASISKKCPPQIQWNYSHSLPSISEGEKNLTNKIFIWIRTTNLYQNNTKHDTKHFVGCLDYMFIKYHKITFPANRSNAELSCWTDYAHQVYNGTEYHWNNVTIHNLDCSFSGMNSHRHCFPDLSNYGQQNYSFVTSGEKKLPTKFKLAWEQDSIDTSCLVEILFRHNTSLVVYIDKDWKVTFVKVSNQSENSRTKTSFKVSPKSIHVLLVNFEYPDLFIRVSNATLINSFIEPYLGDPIQVNYGFSSWNKVCKTFHGKMAIQSYNPQFQLTASGDRESHQNHSFIKIYAMELAIFGIVLLFLLLSLLAGNATIALCRKVNKSTVENIYENQNTNFMIDIRHIPRKPSEIYDYAN